jgi:hypothetical protein
MIVVLPAGEPRGGLSRLDNGAEAAAQEADPFSWERRYQAHSPSPRHSVGMATTELGAALRRWRDQVSPRTVGLPAGGRRRAAGLWREELAQPAGISVDPHAGAVTLDCDVLGLTGADLRIMVYTAEPGSRDAERLAFLAVTGTQALTG